MDGRPDIYNEQELPPTATFVLRKVVVEDGRAYIAAFDPYDARLISLSPVLVQGGGPEDYVYVPPVTSDNADPGGTADNADERQVVLVRREGKVPGQMACVQHPQMKLEEEPPEPENTEDHAATIAKQDFAVRRAGVKAFIDARGALVLDTRESASKVVRIQLPADGVLRVSRNGEADEKVLLAGPALDYMEEVNSYLQEVQAWAIGLQIDPSTFKPITAFTGTVPTLNKSALTAATLHISDDSEAS